MRLLELFELQSHEGHKLLPMWPRLQYLRLIDVASGVIDGTLPASTLDPQPTTSAS